MDWNTSIFRIDYRRIHLKNIYLIVGCSGSGKTTITEQLETKYGLKSIQSYTTRPPRYDGETGHTFISNEEFDKLVDICGYTEFAGNRYCSTVEQVENNDLYVVDPNGVDYFIKSYKGKKTPKIIFIDSDLTTRYDRMVKRAEDKGDEHLIAVDKSLSRIKTDISEFYDYVHCIAHVDYFIENNAGANLDFIVDKIYEYISSCESEVV